jgi:outer membrane receptor protein involved in Fe transport
LIDRLGSIDRTTGGKTERDSLSWVWEKIAEESRVRLQLFGVSYGLNLWSNGSYFQEDPVLGDQVEQEDRRSIFGGSGIFSRNWNMGPVPGTLTLGFQNRYDRIGNVGLYKTFERRRLITTSESALSTHQIGVFVEQQWQWTQNFRSVAGLRHDTVQFTNKDRLLATKRDASAQLTSPKLTTSYRLMPGWQIFASGGQSFHSNDARGVTSKDAPAPGLVPVRGYEVGSSYEADSWARVSLAIWRLHLDSELVYIGDAGTTEASRASRREGIDWLLQISPAPIFHADLELSWARARFKSDPDDEGDQVEGHLPFVAMLGVGSQLNTTWSMAARFRHFGKRPLTADGEQTSQPTSILNLHLAYENSVWEWAVDVLNALNGKDHDIDYYYESQLAGETEPVSDLHFHPVEPASIRFNVGRKF